MTEGSPGGQMGLSSEQRAAIRAVEEEAVLDLIRDFVRRAGAVAERLELYATPATGTGGKAGAR